MMDSMSGTTQAVQQPKFPLLRIFSDKKCSGAPGSGGPFRKYLLVLSAAFLIQQNLVSGLMIDETVNMDTAAVLKYYGYPAETHQVQTSDGYILTLHRIPRETKKPPVLVMHGILDSSFAWVLSGPETALGFQLFNSGYDVWLGNFRGNVYSRGHNKLTNSQKEFWNFSWDDMGKRDLSALVDYVIHRTNQPKIFHMGHSMGTTTFFVLTSSMPAYNKKFIAHFSLSPVGYWGNSASFFWKILAPVETALREFMYSTNSGGFLVNEDAASLQEFCHLNVNSARLCKLFIHSSFGFSNVLKKNESIYNVFMGHVPAGTSVKAFNHYSQLLKSGKFRNYDYHDSKKNMQVYGSTKPPEYNMSLVTAPVSFHYAINDAVSVPVDVLRLYRQLPNPIGLHLIQDQLFNHVDFTIDPNANKLLYRKIIKTMESFLGRN